MWAIIFGILGAVVSADQIMKGLDRPKITGVSIPGGLGMKTLAPEIAAILERSEAELAVLHAQELEQVKEQEELETKIAAQAALQEKIKKIAPLVIIGGVGIGAILLLTRKK